VLHIMRKSYKDFLPAKSSVGSAKKNGGGLLLLYCVEHRDAREQSGTRSVIDITDIKLPSPCRL